jgi:hypothetical protein
LPVSFSQSVAPLNPISPAGAEKFAALQGRYGNEAVRPSPDNSVITKSIAEGGAMSALQRINIRDLSQRIQSDSKLVTMTALYESLGEMPELDKAVLPGMFQFLDNLDALAGKEPVEEGATEKVRERAQEATETKSARGDSAEHEVEAGAHLPVTRRGSSGDQAGQSSTPDEGEEGFEEGIYRALSVFTSDTYKATAIAVARGFFQGKDRASSELLNALDKIAGAFESSTLDDALAQRASLEQAKFAAATLENDPALVRLRYRRRLREKSNLGELFEELREIGLESGFPVLFTEIGSDLAGVSVISDKDYVRSLTRELSRLWQLKSSHEESKEIIRNVEPHLSSSDRKLEPSKVTSGFLYFCAKKSASPADAQSLLEPLKHASLQSQVVFANLLKDCHSRMPDGIWLSSQDRFLQYSALGALCHRLTDAEERAYEAAAS